MRSIIREATIRQRDRPTRGRDRPTREAERGIETDSWNDLFGFQVGRANALKPALQMLGVVLTDDKEDKDKGGIVCRPHPAERRKTLIARYNDTEEFPEESSPSDDGLKRAPQLVQDVELLMKPYTFVHSVTLSRHNSVTCTLKCTDFAEARSMLEMLRSEAIRLSLDKKIEFDWALDKERERTGLTL